MIKLNKKIADLKVFENMIQIKCNNMYCHLALN